MGKKSKQPGGLPPIPPPPVPPLSVREMNLRLLVRLQAEQDQWPAPPILPIPRHLLAQPGFLFKRQAPFFEEPLP